MGFATTNCTPVAVSSVGHKICGNVLTSLKSSIGRPSAFASRLVPEMLICVINRPSTVDGRSHRARGDGRRRETQIGDVAGDVHGRAVTDVLAAVLSSHGRDAHVHRLHVGRAHALAGIHRHDVDGIADAIAADCLERAANLALEKRLRDLICVHWEKTFRLKKT